MFEGLYSDFSKMFHLTLHALTKSPTDALARSVRTRNRSLNGGEKPLFNEVLLTPYVRKELEGAGETRRIPN